MKGNEGTCRETRANTRRTEIETLKRKTSRFSTLRGSQSALCATLCLGGSESRPQQHPSLGLRSKSLGLRNSESRPAATFSTAPCHKSESDLKQPCSTLGNSPPLLEVRTPDFSHLGKDTTLWPE